MGVTKETKEYNKTILQTSFTSLEAIYYLLNTVREHAPMTSADGKDRIFPVARARVAQERGGEWSEEKRDTHAELTLREMGFLRYLDGARTEFEVSDLGNEFLAAFVLTEYPAEGRKVKLSLEDRLSLEEKNRLLLDILLRITVKQEKYGRCIRPYLVLFKLLCEPALDGYLTRDEWASFLNHSGYVADAQYPEILDAILRFRRTGDSCAAKKSDRILTRLVLWRVLRRVAVPDETCACFALDPDFAQTVALYMLHGEAASISYPAVANPDDPVDYDRAARVPGGFNLILYGVPGAGKSWTLQHEYCTDDCAVERLVFHPDYTNGDLVGQLLPVVDEAHMATYAFQPGPFTTVMRRAYTHPQKNYVLIIEEINRGNAPAIFGDLFQLLDRMKTERWENGSLYPAGTSEYAITNEAVAEWVYGDAAHPVRIPSNLSIIGTMNTSDQNTFALDTAFQRRWRTRLIENSFDHVRPALAQAEILDTKVTWQRFCETVNARIVGNGAMTASTEDKRLGVYFVHESELAFDERALPALGYDTVHQELRALLAHEARDDISGAQKQRLAELRQALIQNGQFPEKVLKYLWDDPFRLNREAIFDTSRMDSLEQVIRTFAAAVGEARFCVFSAEVRERLYQA